MARMIPGRPLTIICSERTSGKALLEKLERMEAALKEIAHYGRTYPTSAPEHEICHALVVGVPDMAHSALGYIPD